MIGEFSDAIVAVVLSMIAGIVWLVRLENKTDKVNDLERRLDQHIEEDQEAHLKMLDDLATIRENTAQIKGYLSKNIR